MLLMVGLALEFWKASRQSLRDRLELDGALMRPGLDQVEVMNDDAGTNRVFRGAEAHAILAMFAATNRVPWDGPMFMKLYFGGNLFFNTPNSRLAIGYIPWNNAASYGQYYFQLKSTNHLRRVFEWWRTNEVDVPLSQSH